MLNIVKYRYLHKTGVLYNMTSKNKRVKLTKNFIDSLPLEPAIYRDSELIGFALRVQKSYKTFVVEKKVNGRAIRHTLGIVGQITLIQARQKAAEVLAQMGQGIDPNSEKRHAKAAQNENIKLQQKQPTLVDAYHDFLGERKLKSLTIKDYDKVINHYLVDWQTVKLQNITRKMVQDKHKALSDKSPAQANMAMRVFRAVYNFAVEHYLGDDDNPILPLACPTKTLTAKKSWNVVKRRKTYINDEKLPDWVNAVLDFECRGQALNTNRDFLLTLILTGFRRAECESLTWQAVDIKHGFITSFDPKNGEKHTLPMGSVLWQIMQNRHASRVNDWVFPSAKSATGHLANATKMREKIAQSAGVNFTFHDLRRTFGTIAENLDYGQYTIKRLLNHKSRDVTAGYVQISDKKLRCAMNDIEKAVFGAVYDDFLASLKKSPL